jgi:hypothetical protein
MSDIYIKHIEDIVLLLSRSKLVQEFALDVKCFGLGMIESWLYDVYIYAFGNSGLVT